MGRYDALLQPSQPPSPQSPKEQSVSPPPAKIVPAEAPVFASVKDVPPQTESAHNVIPRYHDTTIPNNRDTMTSLHHDTMIPTNEGELLEAVRKTVKQVGKEPATQRLTLEEKQALRAIEFAYGQKGILTSGNEIIRIATNYIIRDYQKNGEKSILAKVLTLLNS